MQNLNLKIIITCISIIVINDIITIYISTIYYTRFMIFIIIYLLFDIFRIYKDFLDVSKELSIININSNVHKLICEEIKYNNIMIIAIMNKMIILENKLNYIELKLKKNQK
jgi:hypothetical protein